MKRKKELETLLLGNTNKNKPTHPMVNECSWNVRWYDAKTNPPGKMNESVLKVAALSVFIIIMGIEITELRTSGLLSLIQTFRRQKYRKYRSFSDINDVCTRSH